MGASLRAKRRIGQSADSEGGLVVAEGQEDCRVSFSSDESVLELDSVIVAQLCEYVKSTEFKWVNFTACELYFDFLYLRGKKGANVILDQCSGSLRQQLLSP